MSAMSAVNPKMLDAATIEGLCRQAAGGNGDALEQLLCHYHRRLIGFVRRKIGVQWQARIDAEDVVQEAYVAAFESISGFNYGGEDWFYHWMTRIIDHRFYSQVRRLSTQKRSAAREVAPAGSSYSSMLERCFRDSTTPSRLAQHEDAAGALMSCIARLPEEYREVVQRVYLDQEPMSRVAADLKRTEDAVRRMAGRALERLEACMGRASQYLSRPS